MVASYSFASQGTISSHLGEVLPNVTTAITAAAMLLGGGAYAGTIANYGEPNLNTMAAGGLISYEPFGSGQSILPLAMRQSVRSLQMQRPVVDVGAIEQMYALIERSFASIEDKRPNIEFQVDEEPEGLSLFVRVDTHGMDFDEQIRREVAMREKIQSDDRLRAAKNYVVINVY